MHQVKEGEFTATIYTMIKDGRYGEAIEILNNELQKQPKSRPALSLLAYCSFQMQDFAVAAECYESLAQQAGPGDEGAEYRLRHAQSLYRASAYAEALKATLAMEGPAYQAKVLKLQAAIKYGEDDLTGAKSLVEQCAADDPDTENNLGCLLYKEGHFDEACLRFTTAMQLASYRPGQDHTW